MSRLHNVVFERCPVCEAGQVEEQRVRRLLVLESVVGRCTYCGATFVRQSADTYQACRTF